MSAIACNRAQLTRAGSLRGEIWFVQLPVDPPEKGRRPVVIVSIDARNLHQRADTVLECSCQPVKPGSRRIRRRGRKKARAEDVTVVRKGSPFAPRSLLRRLSDTRVCELAIKVQIAMGCLP